MQEFKKQLSHLAVTQTKGRHHDEPEDIYRTPWQRDRDRILHSSAFRRLEYKTQVFIPHEGNDHHRTRLTHSLEVAQVSRSIAYRLGLNENLSEAIALAHDLGHPPFGHAGEEALQQAMMPYGGFSHNTQSLHILLYLEQRYALFDGLNPTWETLEGIAKHNVPINSEDELLSSYIKDYSLDERSYPSLEAQVAAIADDIAYNGHDIDDGLRGGFFQLDDLKTIPLLRDAIAEVDKTYGLLLDEKRRRHETIRRLLHRLITDVADTILRNCEQHRIKTPEDMKNLAIPMANFSIDIKPLRAFLTTHVYESVRVQTRMEQGKEVIQSLFQSYMTGKKSLPDDWTGQSHPKRTKEQNICDYIAGMTDRLAQHLYEKNDEL